MTTPKSRALPDLRLSQFDNRRDVDLKQVETLFQGYFRVDRYHLRHRRFEGDWGPVISREIFERGHAVGVLPYDPVADRVVLIEQFRPGAYAAGWHGWMAEVVAGIIDQGETAEAVAVRETWEEAGLEVLDLVPICRYLASPGGSTESVALFCARVDTGSAGGIHGLDTEGEDIAVSVTDRADALALLEAGKILNAVSVIALQWLALNGDRMRLHWSDAQ